MKKLTRDMITPEMIEAAETVFLAMAWVETVKPIVRAYQKKNMTDMGWGHLPPEHSFTMPQHLWPELHRRNNESRKAANLHVESEEFCPLLVADHQLTQAEWVLCDVMEPITGISHDMIFQSSNALARYHEYINLTLRLLAPFVNPNLAEKIAA
jgi:hypothetical protein